MHLQSCCFANLKPLLFCRSRWRRPSLLLQERQVFSVVAFHMTSQLIAWSMPSDSDYKDGAKKCKQKNSEGVG